MRQRSRAPQTAGRMHATPLHDGPEGSRRCLNILIADDRKTMRRLMEITLGDLGHKAITAKDGLEALDIFLDCREKGIGIDFVITDFRMPNMDGLRLTQAIKRLKPDLPVLIVTATPQLVDREACIKAGALDVMDKSFTNEQIEKAIRDGQKQ